MTWTLITTEAGTVAWATELADESYAESFTAWAKAPGRSASASTTGPTFAAWPLTDELAAWWVALEWVRDEGLTISLSVPPEDPEPWTTDAGEGAVF